MLRVVVLRLRILVHVETGEPLRAPDVVFVIRVAVAQQVEHHQTLGMVGPVAVHRKLLVVHAVPGEGHVDGLRFRILADVAVLRGLAHVPDAVSAAEQVDERPVGQVLDGIVRTVEGAPAGHALEIAFFVEILVVEQFEGLGHGADERSLQQGPLRRSLGRVDLNRGASGHEWNPGLPFKNECYGMDFCRSSDNDQASWYYS